MTVRTRYIYGDMAHYLCEKCGGHNGIDRKECLECGTLRPENIKTVKSTEGRYSKIKGDHQFQ